MKKNRDFNLILIGLIISLFGSAVQRFSFSLYLLDLTNDAAIFSTVMAISVFPFILFAPFAGTLADSANKKKIMIILDFLSFVIISSYLVFSHSTDAKVLLTGAVVFGLAAISSFYTPAVTSMIPIIVDQKDLVKANAKISQVSSFANLAGPVLAGILYGIWGITGVTIMNAVSFFASAILEMFITYEEKREKQLHFSIKQSLIEMKESYVYLKEKKSKALNFIWSYSMYNICLVPILTILLPFVIRNQLGISSQTYGVIEGIVASGMIVGAVFVSIRPKWFVVKRIYMWDYIMAGAILLMLAGMWGHKVVIIAPVWTVAGFAIMMALGMGNVVTLSYTQQILDKSFLGKVSAFSTAVATISVPIGQMLFGWFLSKNSNILLLLLIVFLLNIFVTEFIRRTVKDIV